MARKVLAGSLGAVLATAFYAASGFIAVPSRLLHATPMQAVQGRMPASPIQVLDSTPVRLEIPSIDVDAAVEARGLDSKRNIATPKDYRDVAWYSLGPRPGEPGNAVINGHVSWWTGDAVFTHLARLRTGDSVRVVRADGRVVTFNVTGKQVVDANARIASLFAPSTQSTLTLITCQGVWNPLTQSTNQRLLVSAALA